MLRGQVPRTCTRISSLARDRSPTDLHPHQLTREGQVPRTCTRSSLTRGQVPTDLHPPQSAPRADRSLRTCTRSSSFGEDELRSNEGDSTGPDRADLPERDHLVGRTDESHPVAFLRSDA